MVEIPPTVALRDRLVSEASTLGLYLTCQQFLFYSPLLVSGAARMQVGVRGNAGLSEVGRS